jgi:hypothetical protein
MSETCHVPCSSRCRSVVTRNVWSADKLAAPSPLLPPGRLAGKAVPPEVSGIAYASAPLLMSDERKMDDAENGLQAEGDGDANAAEVVSNNDLANRQRRQQVKQACQQCRRRKIKVHALSPPPSPCRPCQKGRLACAYELPPGRTRVQAMIESHQRLRDELHSYTSLIHSLRCADANSSIHMLGRLRHGDYDSALVVTDHANRSASPGDHIYPWEDSSDEGHHQRARDVDLLAPIDAFAPFRHDAGSVHPPSHSAHDKPSPVCEHHDTVPPQTTSSAFATSHGLPANTTTTNPGIFIIHSSDPRMARQRSEMDYQPRGNYGFQQAEMPLHLTLPSEDRRGTCQDPDEHRASAHGKAHV